MSFCFAALLSLLKLNKCDIKDTVEDDLCEVFADQLSDPSQKQIVPSASLRKTFVAHASRDWGTVSRHLPRMTRQALHELYSKSGWLVSRSVLGLKALYLLANWCKRKCTVFSLSAQMPPNCKGCHVHRPLGSEGWPMVYVAELDGRFFSLRRPELPPVPTFMGPTALEPGLMDAKSILWNSQPKVGSSAPALAVAPAPKPAAVPAPALVPPLTNVLKPKTGTAPALVSPSAAPANGARSPQPLQLGVPVQILKPQFTPGPYAAAAAAIASVAAVAAAAAASDVKGMDKKQNPTLPSVTATENKAAAPLLQSHSVARLKTHQSVRFREATHVFASHAPSIWKQTCDNEGTQNSKPTAPATAPSTAGLSQKPPKPSQIHKALGT